MDMLPLHEEGNRPDVRATSLSGHQHAKRQVCPWWAGLSLPAAAWVAVHLSYPQSPVSSFQSRVCEEWPALQSLTYECSAAITCWCGTHRKYPIIGIMLQTNYLGPR